MRAEHRWRSSNHREMTPPMQRQRFVAFSLLSVIVVVFLLRALISYGSLSSFTIHGRKFSVTCYYSVPSNNSEQEQLYPELIDPFLCTHIIIAFAQVENGTIKPAKESDSAIYKRIVNLKETNPSLKVLLSVGEIVSDSERSEFGRVVSSHKTRVKFVEDVTRFISSHNFDGLDLDWEFPAWPKKNDRERKNFTLLLKEFHRAFANSSSVLSVAVAASESIMQQSYDIEKIAKYVDFINLMSYDYYQYMSYLPITGPNSPIFPKPRDTGIKRTLNIDWSAKHWNIAGMPKHKIMVGIPTYGHSFTLFNDKNTGWYAPAKGIGSLGSGGFITSNDTCGFLRQRSTTKVLDSNFKVPYAFNGHEWISYEDEFSVTWKASYIRENGFGGAMIFSLNTDNFLGTCGNTAFDLTKQVNFILSSNFTRLVVAV